MWEAQTTCVCSGLSHSEFQMCMCLAILEVCVLCVCSYSGVRCFFFPNTLDFEVELYLYSILHNSAYNILSFPVSPPLFRIVKSAG